MFKTHVLVSLSVLYSYPSVRCLISAVALRFLISVSVLLVSCQFLISL